MAAAVRNHPPRASATDANAFVSGWFSVEDNVDQACELPHPLLPNRSWMIGTKKMNNPTASHRLKQNR
jgi:hypothetical protein